MTTIKGRHLNERTVSLLPEHTSKLMIGLLGLHLVLALMAFYIWIHTGMEDWGSSPFPPFCCTELYSIILLTMSMIVLPDALFVEVVLY